MSRIAAAQDFAEESFEGILERLTGIARPETAGPETPPFSPARAGSSSVEANRAGSRVLLPVTASKAVKNAANPNGMELSYEKALRIHGRHRTTPVGSHEVPSAALPRIGASRADPSVVSKAAVKTVAAPNLERSSERGPERSSDRTATAGQPAKPAGNVKHTPAKTGFETKAATPSASKPVRFSKAKASARAKIHASPDSQPKAGAKFPTRSRKSGAGRGAASSCTASGSAPKTAGAQNPNIGNRYDKQKQLIQQGRPERGKNLPRLQSSALQLRELNRLDKLAQPDPLAQPDHRRSVVSVRLTDREFSRLRERADESGISVSAYMRSCVLDAELLRAQVKQALAQMRTYSTAPGPDHFPDRSSDHFPALAAAADTGPTSGGTWFRLLIRSATVLLGPLFPFRRSA